MFYNGDDDEHDFIPSAGRSKLASLFGIDSTGDPGSNESLTYKAPTEPKKKASEDASAVLHQKPSTAAPAVLTAAAVFAYKYVDNQYASQGKLGAAVIGNHTAKDYKILLYYTKEKPVAFAQIVASFTFVIQPNNYATFYDDTRQSWSLMYESEASLLQFVKQVAFSKANSITGGAQKLDSVIIQDLTTGDGPVLEVGDSVELKYSGWLFENGAVGTIFDSSSSSDKPLRFRIGKIKSSRVWEEGIVGMRKGGRRLLIVPPSIPYDFDGKIAKAPADSVTVFELEVLRVKFVRDRGNEGAQLENSAPSMTTSDNRESPGEEDSKPRSRSITDQPPPVAKPDKAKLISRMAKMGQSMLPKLAQPDAAESEVTATSPHLPAASPTVPKPDIPVKPVQQHVAPHTAVDSAPLNQHPYIPPSQHYTSHSFQAPAAVHNMFQGQVPSSQLAVFQPQQYAQVMAGYPQMMTQQYGASVLGPNPAYPPTSMPQPVAAANTSDPNMPMMMMETRQQNTEVRVSLSKISDKVDRISDRIDQLAVQQNASMSLSNSLPTMEVNMLVHSIEKIVSENERMKKELLDKSSHIDGLNVKILQLIQQNQVYAEQSNTLLEQRNVSYTSAASQNQAQVLQLQQDKIDLATRLSNISSQLADSQLEITAFKKKESELKMQLERLLASDSQNRDDLGSHKVQLAETVHQLEQVTSQMRDEQQQRKQLQTQNTNLQETLLELRTQCDALEKNFQEKKKKSGEEIQKMEMEMKEMQANFEAELSSLKERLKHEKNSTEMTTAQQIAQMEDDLNRQWKEKSERIQNSLQDKHQREVLDLNSERHLLEEKVSSLERKVQELKAVRDANEQKIDAMKEEIDELQTWKVKYDGLRTQAVTMKQRYEDRIVELIKDSEVAEQSRELLEERLSRAVEAARRLQSQLSMASAAPTASKDDASTVQTEVKKVMNTVYRRLRSEFVADDKYEGSDIHAVILDVIKSVILEVVQPKTLEQADIRVHPSAIEGINSSETVVHGSTENRSVSPSTSYEQKSRVSTLESSVKTVISEETIEKQEETVLTAVDASSSNQHNETVATEEHFNVIPHAEDGLQKSTATFQEAEAGDESSLLRRLSTISLSKTDNSSDEPAGLEDVDDLSLSKTDNSSDEPAGLKEVDASLAEHVVQLVAGSEEPPRDSAVDTESDPKDSIANCDINEPNDAIPSEKLVSSDNMFEANSDIGLVEPSSVENLVHSEDTRDVIDQMEEDSQLFTDARSEVSENDGDADVKLNVKATENTTDGNSNDVNVNESITVSSDAVVDEAELKHASIPPNNTAQTAKPKSNTSIFEDDDDDDDDLFGNVTSKFVPISKPLSAKKTSTAKETVKQHRGTESDEDVNRKPPPLFGDNSDSGDDDWIT